MKKLVLILFSLFLLTGCGKKTVEVSLAPSQIEKYTAQVETWDEKINNYDPATSDDGDPRPPMDYFIEKARYQGYLGNVGEAIDTLDSSLQLYDISSVAWHNLGRLYERIEEPKKSLAYYEQILTIFPDKHQYNIDIIRMKILLGEKDEALKMYQSYAVMTGFDDPEIFKKIKAL